MSAIAQLGLDASGFISSIAASKAAVFGFKAAVDQVRNAEGLPEDSTKKAALSITAAIVALTAIMAKGTQMAIQYGSSLVDVSYNSGLAASQTMALELAVQRYGLSADSVVPATQKFNAAMQDAAKGTGPLVGILNNAGISMDQLAGMDVATRMQTVASAIKAIKHPTEQAQAAMAIWGAESIKFNEAMQPGKINSAAAALGSQAQLMEQSAGVFARITQVLGQAGSTLSELVANAKNKIQGFFVGMASELAPEILSILESVSSGSKSISDAIKEFAPALAPLIDIVNTLVNMDFAAIGQEVGKAIATTIEAIRGFKLKDLFSGAEAGAGLVEQVKANFDAAAANIKKAQEDAAVRVQEIKKTAQEQYATPEKVTPTIEAPKMESQKVDMLSMFSSLTKVGGAVGSIGGGIVQDTAAYQSVRIQEDIRSYMRELVGIVKTQDTNFTMSPAPGMVLTA